LQLLGKPPINFFSARYLNVSTAKKIREEPLSDSTRSKEISGDQLIAIAPIIFINHPNSEPPLAGPKDVQ